MKEHGAVSCFSGKGFVSSLSLLSGVVDLIAFDILFHLLYTFLSIEDCCWVDEDVGCCLICGEIIIFSQMNSADPL